MKLRNALKIKKNKNEGIYVRKLSRVNLLEKTIFNESFINLNFIVEKIKANMQFKKIRFSNFEI